MQAVEQLTMELDAARAQEASLYEELQSLHNQYASRDEHMQQTKALEMQTLALEHEQQLQEQRLQLNKAADGEVGVLRGRTGGGGGGGVGGW